LNSSKNSKEKILLPYHLKQATIDYQTCSNWPLKIFYVNEDGKSKSLICTLDRSVNIYQCSLDFIFENGSFIIEGNGVVYLNGYLIKH
jgi:hypothetical protein